MASIRKFLAGPSLPLILLVVINLAAGVLMFRDYGISWDEPYFYAYGNAIGYAYSIPEHLSGNFDLERAYGPSGDDHKTRGPAYLVLARGPVYALEALGGLQRYQAWHLVNFLAFQVGAVLVYFLIRRLSRGGKPEAARWAALSGAALFTWQPLLWGHAFINPKDPSFLVFFTASLLAGLRLVDETRRSEARLSRLAGWSLLAGALLGAATAIRVLAPLAGLLVFIYALLQIGDKKGTRPGLRPWLWFVPYALAALVSMLALWPYLWEAPLQRFLEVFRFMSANPTQLQVLFDGVMYRAYDLPRRYLPVYLAITLTEPVWPLAALGLAWSAAGIWKPKNRMPDSGLRKRIGGLAALLLWFVIPAAYVLVKRPPMYDGFRHFLFIIPPAFVLAGLGFEALFSRLKREWLMAGIALLLLLPGLAAIPGLHPYEYAYYNSFVGGTGGAFREYETDYWLTCYKEAMQKFNRLAPQGRLVVHREAYIAEVYAVPGYQVLDFRGEGVRLQAGDYFLVTSRLNEDIRVQRDLPALLTVGRAGAKFCTIKKVK